MKKLQYEHMLPSELQEVVDTRPLAWLPYGLLEWHGPHLPAGLDGIKAHSLCLRAAEIAGGVVLPPNFTSTGGMAFPWTINYPPPLVAQTFFQTLRHLRKYGFKAMIAITGHYGPDQIALLMGAAEMFMATSDAAVVALPEFAMGLDGGYFGDHAAKWETSIMMELFPELVSAAEMKKLAGIRTLPLMRHGIQGLNPAEHASRETGAAIVDEVTRNFAALAGELLGEDGKARARKTHRELAKSYVSKRMKLLGL